MSLKLDRICFKYPHGTEILRNASLSVEGGEAVTLIGANGSGKTTLLMIAAGLLEPDKGTVLLAKKPLKKQLPEARKRIGLVFQDPDDQLFNTTVYDELAFALRQLLNSSGEVDMRVKEVANKFGLVDLLNKVPYDLSMGEKRMVTVASIIAYDPDVLLLDEPTANMSSKTAKSIEQVVVNAKKAGKAVLIASHDIEFVAEVSDRVYVIYDGSIYGGSDVISVLSDKSLVDMADMNSTLVKLVLQSLKPELQNPLRD
ncbi:MAG: energy-coupling factor ABC transporter ATP-binding protein [Nitrososphaeria archaeon]